MRVSSDRFDLRRLSYGLVAAGVALLFTVGCQPRDRATQEGSQQSLSQPPPGGFGDRRSALALFVDRAGEAGVDFIHFNGMSGEHYQATKDKS